MGEVVVMGGRKAKRRAMLSMATRQTLGIGGRCDPRGGVGHPLLSVASAQAARPWACSTAPSHQHGKRA